MKHWREVLKTCSVFQELDNAQLNKIVTACHEEEYESGSYVFKEGEIAKHLYVIEKGKIALEKEIMISAHSHRTATTVVINPGEICGWSGALEERPFTQSARCIEKTQLIAIDAKRLRTIFTDESDLGYQIMEQLFVIASLRYTRLADTLARVLAITAHDMKTPLAAIQSYLSVIIGNFAGEITDKQRSILSRCNERCNGLLAIISNMLDLSQIESLQIERKPVSLIEIAQVCLNDAEQLARKKGLELRADLPAELSLVQGSSSRLQQVFNNLLQNAVKFTTPPGTILLRISESSNEIKVEITDTGVGIKAEEIPKIFDDFYHGTTIETEGSGLGLYICKKVITAHGGRIWAESPCPETGIGSKLSFTVPRIPIPKQTKDTIAINSK